MSCLDDETVAGCVEDRLSETERQAALAHTDECERCRQLLAFAARALVPDDGEPRRSRGDSVGRYQILARIGGGAMGEVFAASDPQLGRKIALKVLRTDLTEAVAVAQRARLVLEAQALARVAHPNVVSVYEVGVAEGHIFIAMELVDGGTLAGWLASAPRAWREIVDVMTAAARGLAAVHAVGLVHRDFKPDNVLIGSDGRVRVTDFGLARVSSGADEPAELMPDGPLDTVKITRAGTLLGTPAYMAPEQLRGEPASAASDQFAFCVTLYEALNRIRPFAGGNVDELLAAQQRPPLRSPSPALARRVPRFVRNLMARGLSADAAERHPNMDALLRALHTGLLRPARMWRAALLTAVTGALVLAARPWWQSAAPCPRIDATFSSARRAQLAAAFSKSGQPSAPFTWRAVERTIDRFTGAWQKRQDQLCAARAGADPCLQELEVELTALLASYQTPDAATVEHALGAAESLTPVAQCQSARPRSSVPVKQRAPLEKELAEIKAADAGAHYAETLPRAAAAVESARVLGDRLLQARALLLRGRLLLDSGDAAAAEPVLFEAFTAASEAGDDSVAAQAGIQEMFALGTRLSRADEARRWLALTRASVRRVGDADLEATFDDTEASLLAEWGQYDAAVAGMERALAAHRRLMGEQSYAVMRDLHNLGWVLLEREDVERAGAVDQQSLELALQLFGPTHPAVAAHYAALGAVATRRGRYKDARDFLERALAMRRITLPHDHPDLAESLGALANVLVTLDALPEALADLNEAIGIDERRLGPDNQQMAMWIYTRGDVLKGLHRLDDAMADYRHALKILERSPNRELVGIPLIGIGEVQLARGQAAGARVSLERAVTLFDVQPRTNLPGLATARFDLGKALWAEGEHARGRKMVATARADFNAAGLGPEDDSVRETEAWLHSHN